MWFKTFFRAYLMGGLKGILTSLICLSAMVCAQGNSNVANVLGADTASGLKKDPLNTWLKVKGHCTACHSADLVIQNRMNRTSWLATIRWMQKEQGLWPLGDDESLILDYLALYYGLSNIDDRNVVKRGNSNISQQAPSFPPRRKPARFFMQN